MEQVQETYQQEPTQQDPPIKRLYDGLYKSKRYTKSFDEFKTQYSTEDAINKLYNGLEKSQSYTKGKDEFYKQYFSYVKKKEDTPSPSLAKPFPSAKEFAASIKPVRDNTVPLEAMNVAESKAKSEENYIQKELPVLKQKAKEKRLETAKNNVVIDEFDPEKFLQDDIEKEGLSAAEYVQKAKSNINKITGVSGKVFDDAVSLKLYYETRDKQIQESVKLLKHKLQVLKDDNNEYKKGDISQSYRPILDPKLSNQFKEDIPEDEKTLLNEISLLKDKQKKLFRAVDYFAKKQAVKIAGKESKKELSHAYRFLVGDKTLEKQQLYEEKGIPISDEDKLNDDLIGLNILNDDLEERRAKGAISEEEYHDAKYNIEEQSKYAINKYPELRSKRIGLLVAQELGSSAKDYALAASVGNEDAIKLIMDKTGLSKKELSFLKYGDVPNETFVGNIAKGITNAATGLTTGALRIANNVLGIDEDRLSYINEGINSLGTNLFGDNPYESTQQPNVIIGKDLQEYRNPKAGNYSYNAASIKNFAGDAIGGLVGFVGGTKGLGALGMSEKAALWTNVIASEYEHNYQNASNVMGKDATEAQKNMYALGIGAIHAAAFEFIPHSAKQKLGFGSLEKNAAKEFKQIVGTGSIKEVDKELLKGWVEKTLEGISKSSGESAKVLAATKGGSIASSIVNAMLGDKEQQKESFDEIANEFDPHRVGEEFFGLALPLGLMEIPKMQKSSQQYKEGLYDAGLHPESYKVTLSQMAEDGRITEKQSEQRKEVVDVMANLLKSIPETNPTTNERLTHSQKVEYAYNRAKEIALKAQKESVKDDVALSHFYDKNAKELVDERKSIIDGTHDQYLEMADMHQRILETGKHNVALNAGTKTEGVKYLQEQALTTPNSIKNSFNGDVELTTDLIARNEPTEIKAEIKDLKEKHKKLIENENKQDANEIQKHIDLLEQGLEKTKKIKESKVEISVEPPMDASQNIEIGKQENIKNEKENLQEPIQQTNEGVTGDNEPITSKEGGVAKEGVGENLQGEGGGKEPPKVEVAKDGGGEKINDKGILNHLATAEKVPQVSKEGFKEKGLQYETKSQKEAEDVAKSVIDQYGIEDAVLLAEAQKFDGDVNSLIYAESLNRLGKLEAEAKTTEEKISFAKKFAEVGIKYDEAGRKGGRFNAAINYFYKKSPLGIQMMENAKRKEGFDEWAKPKEKSWKEFFDEMMKEPEFEAIVKEEVKEGMKKERAEARAKRIEKVNNIFDTAIKKLDNGGAAYSTIIPITPKVLQEALKAMKTAYNAGEKVVKIIEDAVDYISNKMGSSEWDKDKFRAEWESKLKDKETLTDEEIKAKILDRFRNKLKGLNDKQRDELITKSFKKIVESGGLDYEDFRKIISEVTGRGEMTLEEAERLKELVKQTNLVDDAAKNAIEVRTTDAINKYNEAQKTASKASRELGEMLYSKPNILKRLTSLMQLNTLGIASLVNNPVYNIINQMGLRLPVGVVKTLVEKGISAGYKLKGGEYLSETDILSLQTQKEFFKKLGLGTKESLGQFLTGLSKQDYLQKEVYGSQIRPATALRDLWEHYKGEKNLNAKQIIDKMIQASPQGMMAEVIARTLNIGDKPQRYAAEGAQASAFAKALGLKGIDYDLFIEFPREEAYMQYKKKGFSDADASKKADYIKDIIIKEGQRSTFQQDNLVSDMLNKIFGGEQSGIGGFAKSLIVSPYIKIPTNAYWSYFNLINPEVAMLQSMIYGAKSFSKRNKGDNSSAKDLNEAKYWFAHGAVGFATRAVIGTLVAAGIFRSNNSEDDTKKEREGEQFYEQQGSINVSKLAAFLRGGNPDDVKNGLVVQNRWFGHFGSIGNTIAKRQEGLTKEQIQNGQEYMEMIGDNLQLSGLQELEQGIFANTSSLMQLMKKGGSGANNWMMNTLNLMTNIVQPAVYAQISKAQLPYYSKRKADTFMSEIKNNMLNRSSTLRKITGENPPSKIGIWGDVLDKKDNVAMRLFGISRANDDNFAQPIYEDYKKTNNTKFFPSAVKPEIKIGDTVVKLDAKQAEAFEVLVGKQRKDLVAPYINDMAVFEGDEKKYSQLSEEEKIKKLEILYEEGFNNAKELFIKENPQLKENELTDEQKQLKKQKASENETFRKSLKSKNSSW